MTTRLNGIRYNCDIISFPISKRGKYCFSIKAIHKRSRRSSTINNLNQILSDFNIPESDKNFIESDWEVSKREATILVKKAKELFSDRAYLKYLANILDDDRAESEWENREPASR